MVSTAHSYHSDTSRTAVESAEETSLYSESCPSLDDSSVLTSEPYERRPSRLFSVRRVPVGGRDNANSYLTYDSASVMSAPSLAGMSVNTALSQDSNQVWRQYREIEMEVTEAALPEMSEVGSISGQSVSSSSTVTSKPGPAEFSRTQGSRPAPTLRGVEEEPKVAARDRKNKRGEVVESKHFGLYLFGVFSLQAGMSENLPTFSMQGAFDIATSVLQIPNEVYDVSVYFFCNGRFAFESTNPLAKSHEDKHMGIYLDRPLFKVQKHYSSADMLKSLTLADAVRYKTLLKANGVYPPRTVKMELPWKKITWIRVNPDLTVDVCKTSAGTLRYSLRKTGFGISTVVKNSHQFREIEDQPQVQQSVQEHVPPENFQPLPKLSTEPDDPAAPELPPRRRKVPQW